MSILSGKWKFHILGTLIEGNKLGFVHLLREVDGIGTKILTKELKDLDINRLLTLKVMNINPVAAEYFITECGKTLSPIIKELANWRIEYRQ